MSLPPPKVAQCEKKQPGEPRRQRDAKSWHPPRGNEHGPQSCSTKQRVPRTARPEAPNRLPGSSSAPTKHQVCDEDHQPHKNPSEKRRAQHVYVRRPAVTPLQK